MASLCLWIKLDKHLEYAVSGIFGRGHLCYSQPQIYSIQKISRIVHYKILDPQVFIAGMERVDITHDPGISLPAGNASRHPPRFRARDYAVFQKTRDKIRVKAEEWITGIPGKISILCGVGIMVGVRNAFVEIFHQVLVSSPFGGPSFGHTACPRDNLRPVLEEIYPAWIQFFKLFYPAYSFVLNIIIQAVDRGCRYRIYYI